ncbi:hypothetical protein EQM13_07280 [Acidilutibacter cellobiosedens]|jgi:accessory gene regulator B|uniref:Accessory gene regulator B n=1 Tax=Acidilutibacter cellobiosedens TaxID=2507161 RepID=A0A410QBI3_9FIRM|nr:accessory gene regulator B family protein [Acidilutibacter cellobiosedens]QAT61392.1 hypothetical protein EQM13_07280 [Acidilutibacter cellobiosedens]
MIEFLAHELSVHLVANKVIPIEEMKYYKYGIELILNDLLIFSMIIIIIALITDTFLISILFAFGFCLLRAYTGGYHSKSYAGCYTTAMINYFSLLTFNSVLEEHKLYIGVVVIILSIPIIWKFSLIKNSNNPFNKMEEKKYRRISRMLIIIMSLFFTIAAIFFSDKIGFVIAWSIFATALLMLPMIILQKKEETSNEKTMS